MPAERGKNLKPKLNTIAVFGANKRIGQPVAQYIAKHSPETKLRVITRSEKNRAQLMSDFPNADLHIANYYDLPSLERALRGADGVFVVTPDFLDEERAMTNFKYAVRRNAGGVTHVVRLVADPPGMTLDRVSPIMLKFGGGTAMQHMIAKNTLKDARLPITYVNIGAYFMQNFSGPLFQAGLRSERVLAVQRNRRMGFIDTDDIGACCAALLLSDNHRHIGQTYHLDNGHDVMWFDEVADLMTEVWGEKITFDGSDETYERLLGDSLRSLFNRPDNGRNISPAFRNLNKTMKRFGGSPTLWNI